VFEFVAANQADHPITMMCALLEVSTSGFYAWRSRPPSARAVADTQLTERIVEIHNDNRRVYGRPRIHAELAADGTRVSGKRVARLMRAEGICGASRRKRWCTTKRDRDARPAPDLVDRDFTVDNPDQLWVADITYVPTWAGFVYLAVVLDAWSRRVVGWMAIWQRRPADVVHHSDQGCQYTSIAFGLRCREAGVRPSMGSVGDAYDNAMAESFFATLETECLDQRRFRTRTEARFEPVSFIEGFYNPRRRHSALDYQSPVDYERNHAA
jgi:putative transposase